MKNLILSLFIITVISVVFSSCKKDKEIEPENDQKNNYVLVIENGAQSIELENNSKSDKTFTYTAALVDQDGNVSHDFDVSWSSSDNDILAIAANGSITVKTAGSVTITASVTVEDVTFTTSVPLAIQLPTLFVVAPAAILYEKGGELQLEAVYFSTSGQSPSYTYSSSNTAVASVNSTGLVSFAGEGNCVITVTANLDGNPAFYVPVVVFEVPGIELPVTYVKLNKNSVNLLKDETDQLTAKAYNLDGEVTGKTFEWSSSNSNIAGVDQTGKITPVSPGIAYVRATCNGMFDQAEVTVYPDTMVIVTPMYAEITQGSSYQFTAKAYKASRTILSEEYNVNFSWMMPDFGPGFEMFNIGTVDNTGLVTVNYDAMIGMISFVFAYDPNNLNSVGASMVMVKLDY